MSQPLGGLALRAAMQAVREARWSFPSSSMASTSRHQMSLAWDCWIEQALEMLLDSASLMAVEQWFAASAKVRVQSSSISLRQAACQTLASLISAVWQVSTSWMVWVQRAFASLTASVVSDSIWQRAMPKLETCLLCLASREDLVTNRSPRALLASSWRWATSMEVASLLGPWVLTNGAERHVSPPMWYRPSLHPLRNSLGRRYPLVWWSPPA